MKYSLLILALITVVIGFLTWPTTTSVVNSLQKTPDYISPEPELTLTLEEKVGLLFMAGHWKETPTNSTQALIDDHHIGGVIIMSAPTDTDTVQTWTSAWQDHDREFPLLIATDQEGGVVQRLKGPGFTTTSQRELDTADEAYELGLTRGEELVTVGININFAPVVETSILPTSFLYPRVFKEPTTIPELTTALVEGMADTGVIATIKHYPGHADEPTDSHLALPVVPLSNTTFTEHTKNFTTLIDVGVPDIIMTAHVLFPTIDIKYPATLSKTILTDQLRTEAGYQGVIITDDMTMDAIDTQFTTEEAALLALQAGADIILFAAEPDRVPAAITRILQAIESGEITEERIDESVRRILELPL